MLLNAEERETIRIFARSRMAEKPAGIRETAVAIFYLHLAEHVRSDRNQCPEMEFMSEVLSPCPDLAYRAMLRKRITSNKDQS